MWGTCCQEKTSLNSEDCTRPMDNNLPSEESWNITSSEPNYLGLALAPLIKPLIAHLCVWPKGRPVEAFISSDWPVGQFLH